MLGVRFLDVDFMRINFACASPTVYVIRLFCTVVKGRKRHRVGNRWSRSRRGPARMGMPLNRQGGGVCEPPGGRARENRKFIQAPSPEIWSEMISGSEEVLAGWPVFGLPPWKKFPAA